MEILFRKKEEISKEEDIFNSKEIKNKFGLNRRKREKLVKMFEALLSAKSCNLGKISAVLKTKNRPGSDHKGMQRFFAGTKLCEIECARLIWSALGIEKGEKVILIFDRAYWIKEKTHLNFIPISILQSSWYTNIFQDISGQ